MLLTLPTIGERWDGTGELKFYTQQYKKEVRLINSEIKY